MSLLITISNLTRKFIPGNDVRLESFWGFTNLKIVKIGSKMPKYYSSRLKFQTGLNTIIKKQMQCGNKKRKHPCKIQNTWFTLWGGIGGKKSRFKFKYKLERSYEKA